jgi:CDP-diglyceride synthetase
MNLSNVGLKNEYINRFIMGMTLMGFTILAREYREMYLLYMYNCMFQSLRELIKYSNYYYSIHILYINFIFFFFIFTHVSSYNEVMNIIIYNSVSDACQYFGGKFFGTLKLFSFTSKTLEGYMSGFLFPCILFYNHPYKYIIFNFLGMVGGCLSSIIKRKIGVKHWGKILGSHGGINDRLDSIMIPVIFYFTFYNK